MKKNEPPIIRQVQAQNLADVRDTIIKMLTNAPHAFGDNPAEAQSRSSAKWEACVQCWAEGHEEAAFLASDTSGICGFVWGSRKDKDHPLPSDGVVVGKLWVYPRRRGMGLGRALMEVVHEWAKKVRAKRSFIGVIAPNPKLVQFYEHLGYCDIKRPGVVSDTDNRKTIVMAKVLSG